MSLIGDLLNIENLEGRVRDRLAKESPGLVVGNRRKVFGITTIDKTYFDAEFGKDVIVVPPRLAVMSVCRHAATPNDPTGTWGSRR